MLHKFKVSFSDYHLKHNSIIESNYSLDGVATVVISTTEDSSSIEQLDIEITQAFRDHNDTWFVVNEETRHKLLNMLKSSKEFEIYILDQI